MKRLFDWLAGAPERRIALALLALCAMVYIPLAGNYGMWDPWESHYGEVARQMAERNDWVSLWWPGSPAERSEFWSKPVLTFWVMGLAMKLGGLEWAHAPANQVVSTWRVEWACRLPFVLASLAAIWAVWSATRRLAGTRAATLAAVVLATASQWALITRQAMTDMLFVAPMTIALAFAALALLLPEEERERELERGAIGPAGLHWSYPRDSAFYVFVALFALTVLPQLITISIQVQVVGRFGGYSVRMAGIVAMLPYFALFLFSTWWCGRARNQRQLYLFSGYVLCGIASLAKGPAGLALPAIVLVVYLILAGRWSDILFKLELVRGALIFITTAFPWYHAMLIRHGFAFWREFIGDNYVNRAGGRHGDRGTFEYYLQYIGYGLFPWSGLATLGTLFSFSWLRGRGPRAQLAAFALVWLLVDFTTVTLVNTKFHHYILPALPAIAILTGLFIDELLRAPSRAALWGLGLVGVPMTFLCGRDLAAFPPRILWMFNYDYVNAPGIGRPWPTVAMYGQRYEYGRQILVLAIAATLATAALGFVALWTRREREPGEPNARAATPALVAAGLVAFVIALGLGIAAGPATPNGLAPKIAPWAWLVPTLLMLPFVAALAWLWGGGQRARSVAFWSAGALAVVWCGFILDKVLIELSPHWAQKHVIAAYYRLRKGPEEPLIAWQLNWRGENFYTRNEVYRSSNPNERTVFLGDRNTENLQKYFGSHHGRVFFVIERVRYETLRGMLPVAARPTLQILDESNNKLYLASAELGPSAPVRPRSERLDDQLH